MTIYSNDALNALSNMISQVYNQNHSVMYRQQQNQVDGNQQHQQQQFPVPQMQQQSMQQVQPHAAVAVAATPIDSTSQSYWNGHSRLHRPLFLSHPQFYNHENFISGWSSSYPSPLSQYLQYPLPSPSQPQSPYYQQQLPSQHAQLPQQHTSPHNLQQHSPPHHLQQHSPQQQQQQQQHIHQHALSHQHLQDNSPPHQYQHPSPQHYQQHLSPQQHMQHHSSPEQRSSPEQQHVNGQIVQWNMNNENGGMGVGMPINANNTMNGHTSSSSSHYTTPTTSPNDLNGSYASGNMNVPCTADDMNLPSTSGMNLPTSCINLPSTSGMNISSTSGMNLPSTSRNNGEINMPCTSRRQACTKTERRSPYGWMKKPSYQSEPKPACNSAATGNADSSSPINELCCRLETLGKTRTKDKYRVVYSDYQRLELEKEFHTNRYITIKRKNELALQLQLTDRQVKIWFQNRRAKERKIRKKQQEQQLREQEQTQLAIVAAAAAASGVPIYSATGGEVMMLGGHLMHVNDNVSSIPPPPPPPLPSQPLPPQPQVPQPQVPQPQVSQSQIPQSQIPQPQVSQPTQRPSLPIQYPHHTRSN